MRKWCERVYCIILPGFRKIPVHSLDGEIFADVVLGSEQRARFGTKPPYRLSTVAARVPDPGTAQSA